MTTKKPAKKPARWLEVYLSGEEGWLKRDWYWRVVARNGRILADSGEGYRQKGSCLRMAKSLFGDTLEVQVDHS